MPLFRAHYQVTIPVIKWTIYRLWCRLFGGHLSCEFSKLFYTQYYCCIHFSAEWCWPIWRLKPVRCTHICIVTQKHSIHCGPWKLN